MLAEDFLKEYQEELTARRMEISEELDLIRTKVRENEKFLELLESDEKAVFTEFSPREISSKNSGKIREVREELSSESARREELAERLSEIDKKLEDLDNIFKTEFDPLHNLKGNYSRLGLNSGQAKQLLDSIEVELQDKNKDENGIKSREVSDEELLNNEKIPDQNIDITEYEKEQRSVAETFYLEMMSLVNACKQIDRYILSDPMRGKIELKQITDELENITKLLE